MGKSGKSKTRLRVLRNYFWALLVLWTVLVGLILFWNLLHQIHETFEVVYIQAQSALEKDIVYRQWTAMHGGVYVPLTEQTRPNPYLSHVEERDIETPSGRKLTLMNPAYMTRQVHEMGAASYGLRGHITSLDPIRPANAADLWETEALKAFEQGAMEASSVEKIDEGEYLRLMRPLITEQGCMKCHAEQGYKVGDLRGGISVSVPMAPIQAIARGHALTLSVGHFVLWLLGAGGISLGRQRLKRRIQEREYAEEQIEGLSKFPSENPNPVMRIAKDGVLLYANSASESLLTEWGCKTGQLVPDNWQKMVMEAFGSGGEKRIDSEHLDRTYSFVIAPVTEVGYANLYGRDISERRKVEKERETLLHNLEERVKELTCMYSVSRSIRQRDTLESIFQDVAKFIPPGWHYPEMTCARVCFDGSEYVSDSFKETQWKQVSNLVVDGEQRGSVEVYYLEEKSTLDEGSFLKEERNLIDGIAHALSEVIKRKQTEEKIHNMAKFPSENPNPVLRIVEDGTILYSNDAGSALLSKWERQVGESAPHDWCQLIGDVIDSNRNKIIEVKYRDRIVSFVIAPVAKAGYVNIYGRDVTQQTKAEHALKKAYDDLEEKVQQRTAELSDVVSALREEARERSLAQQKLQQSEARLQNAQRIAHIGNWEWDIVDNQLWWSDEVYRIFGLRPKEFGAIYEAFLSYVHPDDRELVKQSVNEALYESKPYSINHRIVRPDGTERIVHEQAEIIHNADKSPIRMRGTVQDVTAQKQAEEYILDNHKQLRSLTAELLLSEERERRKIATDLHDSIGQILAFSDRELGTLQKSLPQKLMESVEEIRHHIKQAVKQTRTLTFDLSPPSLYDLGFEAAIEELVEQFSKERKIECSFESRDQYKPLADHVKILLYRSIRELLMNVAKHSKAKLVRIASSRVNNDILITVEDDGTGFDASKLEFKAGNSRGFGLFSIRERLRHIGGKFDIQSGDGKGTRITLLVPLKIKN